MGEFLRKIIVSRIDISLPFCRTNHVELYINGSYFGLYRHVEQMDEDYLEKRFKKTKSNLYKLLYPIDLNNFVH